MSVTIYNLTPLNLYFQMYAPIILLSWINPNERCLQAFVKHSAWLFVMKLKVIINLVQHITLSKLLWFIQLHLRMILNAFYMIIRLQHFKMRRQQQLCFGKVCWFQLFWCWWWLHSNRKDVGFLWRLSKSQWRRK